MGKLRDEYCTLCSRYKDCKSVSIGGIGSTQPKLMVVVDAPTKFDDTNNTVLQSSNIFEQVLYDVVGIPREDIYITYALKCYSFKDKPSPAEVRVCSAYLVNEIEELKPEAILVLGEVSMNMVCSSKTISKWRGKQQTTAIGKKALPVMATYSPFYIQNNMSMLEMWANDILKAWNLSKGIVDSVSKTQMVFCDSVDKIETAIRYCKEVGMCSFDFETCKIDDELGTFDPLFYATSISLSFQAGSGYVIPLEHKDSPFSEKDVKHIMGRLKVEIFENPNVRKLAHNLNFDFHVCRVYGITKLRGRIDDTMLMQHLIYELDRRGLKELVSKYFPEFAGYENDLEGMEWSEIPLKTLAQYNATDTDLTLRMCTQLESILQEDPRVYVIYRNLTMAAFRPLWETETRGMLIDREFLNNAIKEVDGYIENQIKKLRNNKVVRRFEQQKLEQKTTDAINDLEAKLDAWLSTHKEGLKTELNYREKIQNLKSGALSVYDGLNFGSPKQLQELLYFSPFGFRFNTFETGTGKEVLEELTDDTGFISDLLLLRSMEKMQGTYLKGIEKRLDSEDRIHTNFRLDGTVSGRLSSRNPNLQNIPNPYKLSDELAIKIVKLVKQSFVPPKGYTLIQIDYSQAELRIIASFANEDTMLKAYQDNIDLHALTGANTMGMTLDEFYSLEKPQQKAGRQRAKAVNFGLIYGMSAKGFQNYAKTDYKIEMTSEEAEATRDAFFTLYPNLLVYHNTYQEKARKFGWVRTLFGRKRHTPEIHNTDDFKRSSDERNAINSPIQGTAGEMTVFSIALLYNRLKENRYLVNTVHDSILFYVPDDEVAEAVKEISFTCENLPTQQYFGKSLKRVSMKVDAEGSKENWASLKEIE